MYQQQKQIIEYVENIHKKLPNKNIYFVPELVFLCTATKITPKKNRTFGLTQEFQSKQVSIHQDQNVLQKEI